jgi:hypothetical protein
MPVMVIAKFENFFRRAAELDVDRADFKRYDDFISRKIDDLLVRAQANAKANARDVIEPQDLPLGKGLVERMHQFRRLDQEQRIGIAPLLDELTPRPPDYALSDETEARFPEIVGGLSLALAETFKIIDPKVKHPASEEWERGFRVFDTLL